MPPGCVNTRLLSSSSTKFTSGCGAKIPVDKKTGMVIDTPLRQVGEFRAERGHSVIRGLQVCGFYYTWPVNKPPIMVDFESIVWPTDIGLSWLHEREDPGTGNPADLP